MPIIIEYDVNWMRVHICIAKCSMMLQFQLKNFDGPIIQMLIDLHRNSQIFNGTNQFKI